MSRLRDLTNNRYGRLLVIKRGANSKNGQARWYCICDCGVGKEIASWALVCGRTSSCGCLQRESAKKRPTTHGYSRTPTYGSWLRMHARCNNPNSDQYQWYGAKGITVCKRWQSFENFLKDMGERPKGKTLDRINPDKGYTPSNCRWATPSEQMRNTHRSIHITFEGKKRPLKSLAEHLGIQYATLLYRWRKHNKVFL